MNENKTTTILVEFYDAGGNKHTALYWVSGLRNRIQRIKSLPPTNDPSLITVRTNELAACRRAIDATISSVSST